MQKELPAIHSKCRAYTVPQARPFFLGCSFRIDVILVYSLTGDGCVDKPLATLWKNHTTTDKPNIVMKVTVCASGLKAWTKEHGLTEYWAHRITFCEAEPAYPKVFCWIYRYAWHDTFSFFHGYLYESHKILNNTSSTMIAHPEKHRI